MNLSLKITGAKGSQQCDAASLFGGFWKVKTLVDMHYHVWATRKAVRGGGWPRATLADQSSCRSRHLGTTQLALNHSGCVKAKSLRRIQVDIPKDLECAPNWCDIIGNELGLIRIV
ncbi:hypothetical protein FEAC_28240 [Ferrimicrobium acidiphilum DSM 19497]|uniref:Uncharacterized protein n=1 Tax=Ferrimicrobium acidiphilum DSM 19497 TaxID=1121877 RepID=A0A0D8FQ94_9ACTN|nr:hypothetical protein FEAC_28240 [Ferrimicrobium acidiphilum DSM 19497]